MYLKNSLIDKTAGMRTANGIIILKAQEVIKIEKNEVLGKYPSCIVVATEEEYLNFTKQTSKVNKTVDKEEKETVEVVEEIKEEVEEEIKEETNNEGNEVLDDKQKEALNIETVDNKTEKELLEEKLEQLKQTWLNTNRPKKKEQIQAEIKELQEKLEKLQ